MKTAESICYIGVGTNMGDRRLHIKEARSLIEERGVSIVDQSVIEETAAVEMTDQPPFLNTIFKCKTTMSPQELLTELLAIEDRMGRVRVIDKGPRIIDLDILLYGDMIINTETLHVPHPGICKRWFILKHLVQLDPSLYDPADRKLYRDIYHEQYNNDGQ